MACLKACCKCGARCLVILTALLTLMIGLAITAAAIAALVTPVSILIWPWLAGSAIGVGVLIIFASITGFLGGCRKERFKCWICLFMTFNFIIFGGCLGICVSAFIADDALHSAGRAHVADNMTSFEQTVSDTMRDITDHAYDKCDPTYNMTSYTTYKVECKDDSLDWLSDEVNDNCLNEPINLFANSSYSICLDSKWWGYEPPEEYGSGGIESIYTAKGIFCMCFGDLIDFLSRYFTVGKWIMVGISFYFFCVFFCCCYLLCCVSSASSSKEVELKYQSSMWARP